MVTEATPVFPIYCNIYKLNKKVETPADICTTISEDPFAQADNTSFIPAVGLVKHMVNFLEAK